MKKNKMIKTTLLFLLPICLIGLIPQNSNLQQSLSKNKQLKTSADNYTVEQIELGNNLNNNYGGAIINDGTNDVLYMWGDNTYGQLGTGDKLKSTIPVAIDINGNNDPYDEGQLNNLTLSWYSTGIVVNDPVEGDLLYTWGMDRDGELGNGPSLGDSLKPQLIPAAAKITIKALDFNQDVSAAIVNYNGHDDVYTWGNGGNHSLGNGIPTTDLQTPEKIDLGIEYDSIELLANNGLQMFVTTKSATQGDKLIGWGLNNSGQFGNGTTNEALSPIEIDFEAETGISGEISLIGGDTNSSGIVISDGTNDHLFVTGSNSTAQLGLNLPVDEDVLIWTEVRPDLSIPNKQITSLTMDFIGSSACVINNQLYAWGNNTNGQLGLGNRANSIITEPTLVDTTMIDGTLTITSGGSSFFVLANNGSNQIVYGAGNNKNNQLAIASNDLTNYPSLTKTMIQSYNPEIISDYTEVSNINDTEAKINYFFPTNGANPTEVRLLDSDNTVINTNETPFVDENGYLSGNFQLTGLNPGADYLYQIEVDYLRLEAGRTSTNSVDINFTTTNSSATEIVNPTVTITNNSINNTTSSAEFIVTATPGNDSVGTAWNYESYQLYDSGNNQINQSQITNNGDGSYTVNGLTTNTSYNNWSLTTNWSSTTDGTLEIDSNLPAFATAKATVVDPTIGAINFINSTATTAKFDITLNSGVTSNGNDWVISSYTVYDENSNPYPSDLITPGIINNNFYLRGLSPNTSYSAWSLTINWVSDYNGDEDVATTMTIPDFATSSYKVIEPTVAITIDDITATSVTLTQTISDYGQTSDGSSWIYNDSFKVYDGTNELTNLTNNPDGSFTINGLTPETTYDSLSVKTTFTNPNEDDLIITTNVESFTTDQVVVVDPTTKITFVSSKKTTATFRVEFDSGVAPSGQPWIITNYQVSDGSSTVPSENIIDNGNGTFTINNLTKNTDYSLYTVEITYSDSANPTVTTTSDPIVIDTFGTASSLKQYLELGAVVIIIVILVVVVIFVVLT